jgi:hypothetical protein
MEYAYFTLAAVVLYLVSDWILQAVERGRGKRFEHREVIFFCILCALAIASFALIRSLNSA